jgi:hypothetical protein
MALYTCGIKKSLERRELRQGKCLKYSIIYKTFVLDCTAHL